MQTLMIIVEYSEATIRQRELSLMALSVMEALLKLIMYYSIRNLEIITMNTTPQVVVRFFC